MNRPPHRRGTTPLEVLVILAISLLIAAITVPKIQAAREKARQTQCRNNLTTLGFALFNYQQSMGVYPPGVVAGQTASGAVGAAGGPTGWTWRTMVLPFLDSEATYNAIDFDRSFGTGTPNGRLISSAMESWRCPSDPRPAVVAVNETSEAYHAANAASSSYYGSVGAFEEPLTAADVPAIWTDDVISNGVFGVNSSVELRDIRDGSSNTIATGESAYGPSSLYGTITGSGELLTTRSNAVPDDGFEGVDADETVVNAALRSGEYRLNSSLPAARLLGFSSHHPDGANFGYADGTVRFITVSNQFVPRPGSTEQGCDAAPYDASRDAVPVQNGRCGQGVYGIGFQASLPGPRPPPPKPGALHMDQNLGRFQRSFSRSDKLF